jgi:hypothetical protein
MNSEQFHFGIALVAACTDDRRERESAIYLRMKNFRIMFNRGIEPP